jgi:hypothetical protein
MQDHVQILRLAALFEYDRILWTGIRLEQGREQADLPIAESLKEGNVH